MNIRELKSTQKMLSSFVNEFKEHIGRSERIHWCQLYLSGLLLDGERKSIQPMSQRLPGGNEQALQQFVNQSPWTQSWSYEAIVFDAGYGEIKEFRNTLDERGELFIGQVPESHHFWPHDVATKQKKAATGRPRAYPEIADRNQKAMSAKDWCNYFLTQGTRWKKIKFSLKSKQYTEVIAVQVREVNPQWYWRLGNRRQVDEYSRLDHGRVYPVVVHVFADFFLADLMRLMDGYFFLNVGQIIAAPADAITLSALRFRLPGPRV